ncbi:MAG: hypothetical protein ACK5IC_08990 [Moheibacter sp.]
MKNAKKSRTVYCNVPNGIDNKVLFRKMENLYFGTKELKIKAFNLDEFSAKLNLTDGTLKLKANTFYLLMEDENKNEIMLKIDSYAHLNRSKPFAKKVNTQEIEDKHSFYAEVNKPIVANLELNDKQGIVIETEQGKITINYRPQFSGVDAVTIEMDFGCFNLEKILKAFKGFAISEIQAKSDYWQAKADFNSEQIQFKIENENKVYHTIIQNLYDSVEIEVREDSFIEGDTNLFSIPKSKIEKLELVGDEFFITTELYNIQIAGTHLDPNWFNVKLAV